MVIKNVLILALYLDAIKNWTRFCLVFRCLLKTKYQISTNNSTPLRYSKKTRYSANIWGRISSRIGDYNASRTKLESVPCFAEICKILPNQTLFYHLNTWHFRYFNPHCICLVSSFIESPPLDVFSRIQILTFFSSLQVFTRSNWWGLWRLVLWPSRIRPFWLDQFLSAILIWPKLQKTIVAKLSYVLTRTCQKTEQISIN